MAGVQAGLLAGYGVHGDPNFLGVGLGFRVGYAMPSNLYIGGTFIYHLGSSQDYGTSILGDESVKFGIYYFGAEVGYDLYLGPVILRPMAGIGLATAHASVCLGGTCASGTGSSNLYIAPGAVLMFPVTSSIFIGADVRYLIVTGSSYTDQNGATDSASALSFFGTVGMKF
jgi:hypothetical protein